MKRAQSVWYLPYVNKDLSSVPSAILKIKARNDGMYLLSSHWGGQDKACWPGSQPTHASERPCPSNKIGGSCEWRPRLSSEINMHAVTNVYVPTHVSNHTHAPSYQHYICMCIHIYSETHTLCVIVPLGNTKESPVVNV